MQTPRFCGQASIAGTLLRAANGSRGLRINWLIVGISALYPFKATRPAEPDDAKARLRSLTASSGPNEQTPVKSLWPTMSLGSDGRSGLDTPHPRVPLKFADYREGAWRRQASYPRISQPIAFTMGYPTGRDKPDFSSPDGLQVSVHYIGDPTRIQKKSQSVVITFATHNSFIAIVICQEYLISFAR